MNSDDITAIADETHTATTDGTQVLFRAYLDEEGRERLIWKIADATGNNATLDFKDATIILPQGRELYINGERCRYLSIPRWLADALNNDFAEFPDHLKADEEHVGDTSTHESDKEGIKPIFDDIEVDTPSQADEGDQ